MRDKPVVAIDGPAGAGKSTISRQLAERLSFIYLDTGALYRALALALVRLGFSGNEGEINGLCRDIRVTIRKNADQLHVFVGEEDVTEILRTEEIGLLASRISAMPAVREALLSVQRDIAKDGGVVAEGRDMGTTVFPDAEIKFFLDASAEKRAERRHRELLGKGVFPSLRDVENDMILRDRQDRERSISPLRPSPDAVVVDSTEKSIPQVIDIMIDIINNVLVNRLRQKERP